MEFSVSFDNIIIGEDQLFCHNIMNYDCELHSKVIQGVDYVFEIYGIPLE